MKKPLVIIGSGHAGYTLARAFRQHDTTTPVVVLTEDGGEHYPKPQLSHGFAIRPVLSSWSRTVPPAWPPS